MKERYFIITVDTEGDNLWEYKEGENIGTRNAEYIPRFQNLCEKYGFKPVYLTNYEMAMSDTFVKETKEWIAKGNCEIGVHLHAWNNPPYYELNGKYSGNPYLIEYPEDIMRAKFKAIYELIVNRFGIIPVSHRAGRWAMNDAYFNMLNEFGILLDCSYTPGKYWEQDCGKTISNGPDYRSAASEPVYINNILEVPMTLSHIRLLPEGSWKHKLKSLIIGKEVWLRSAMSTEHDMMILIDRLSSKTNILEFMIHSSELMPGGSPYFKRDQDINKHFETMNNIFRYVKNLGSIGVTLKEYKQIYDSNK